MYSVNTGNQTQYVVADSGSETTMPSVNPVKITFNNTRFVIRHSVEQPLSANQVNDQDNLQELTSPEEALFYKSIRQN